MSLSARRAWIEILTDDVSTGGKIQVALRKESVDRNMGSVRGCLFCVRSLSARRAWIEILLMKSNLNSTRSLSARRAWIEILPSWSLFRCRIVALRKESVDRNSMRRDFKRLGLLVALRKESVDRNI